MQSQVREAQRVADDWRLDVAEKKESLARGRARVKEAVDGEDEGPCRAGEGD